jgi:uncharacterized membrane protein YfcA
MTMSVLIISLFNINPLFFLLLGFCVSTMSGFYGIGGGWLITPALNILGVPMPYAIGTSLVYIIIVSGLGTITHRKIKNIKYIAGIIIGVSAILGIYLGKKLILHFEQTGTVDSFVRVMYIIFLIIVGIYMLVEQKIAPSARENSGRRLIFKPHVKITIDENRSEYVSAWALILSGITIGFLNSTMGVGGGFVLLPILIYMVKLPVPVAAGTSLFTVLIAGVSGAAAYIVSNNVDWAGVVYMTITSIAGTILGASATKKVDPGKIKMFFALTLFLGGISVLLKQLQFDLMSNVAVFGIAGVSTLSIIYTAYIRGSTKKNK